MKSNVVVVVTFTFPAISLAQVTQPLQTSLDPASCLVPGQISTFSGCSTFYSTDEYCSSMLSTNSLGFQSCYCDQAVLDSIFEYGASLPSQTKLTSVTDVKVKRDFVQDFQRQIR